MVLGELVWTDRKGGSRGERGQLARLAKKLETLRCSADLWVLDEYGVKIEIVGGCEPADGNQDDKRIKWQWWYDATSFAEKPDHPTPEDWAWLTR